MRSAHKSVHKEGAGREENLTNAAAAAEEALREEQHHIVEATHTACGYLETSSDRSEGAKPSQQWKSLRWRTRAATSSCSHDTCGRAHTERHGGRRGCAHLAARGISVRKKVSKDQGTPERTASCSGSIGSREGRSTCQHPGGNPDDASSHRSGGPITDRGH